MERLGVQLGLLGVVVIDVWRFPIIIPVIIILP